MTLDTESQFIRPWSYYAIATLASPDDQEVIDWLLEKKFSFYKGNQTTEWEQVIATSYALYQLGYNKHDNFELIRQQALRQDELSYYPRSAALEALSKIGSNRAIELLGRICIETDDYRNDAMHWLSTLEPNQHIIEVFTECLMIPPYEVDMREQNSDHTYHDHPEGECDRSDFKTIDKRPSAAQYLGSYGADAIDALPHLIDLYNDYQITGTGEYKEYNLARIEQAAIRIHEGI